jgi:hypothetical protein
VILPNDVQAEAGPRMMREVHSMKNGKQDPMYTRFMHMHDRCSNPECEDYKDYGGAQPPVTVCPQWAKTLEGYGQFLTDMGEKPGPEYSIHRINPEGNYEPDNVKWVTAKEQARVKRGVLLTAVESEVGSEVITMNQQSERFVKDGVPTIVRDPDGKEHYRRVKQGFAGPVFITFEWTKPKPSPIEECGGQNQSER